MDGFLALVLSHMPAIVGVLWMLVPSYYLYQAVKGLWRRWRLRAYAVPISATVTEVLLYSAPGATSESTVVDLMLAYVVDEGTYVHRETRTDHLIMQYQVGSRLDLLYERGDPANVMAASRRPWDDVAGPVVFSVLLVLFMGWLLLIVSSQLQLSGII
ncbi:MAG: DUF3592 domain-containing protein [Hyphomicrobiaceae bacterium]